MCSMCAAHDEGRAEEAADDRAQPADDHHEQQLERTRQVERQRLPRTQVDVAPQGAGHADDERTDGERGELGVHGPDADDGGGHVHVADRHPLAADGAAHQVLGQQAEDHHQDQHEQVLFQRALHGQAEGRQRRHRHVARR
ncbi:hypothetical protein G6F22_018408 [Rhizopus arrhizus]|nr:hypothetical protein G6F22_018408 [Rhizopus arrhizus]